jgi:hypothetical protein
MKTHLRTNKNPAIKIVAACAINPHREGQVRNGRTSYQHMASAIVGWVDFQRVPAADRCAHCVEAALIIRNRQRAAKGLPPVASTFEVTTTTTEN